MLLLAGCGSPNSGQNGETYVMPTPRPPMTLAPTYTPPATPAPLPTITPPPARETAVPDTPVPFDQTVLELRYQIPLLGLDRRLQGNVANQLIVADETLGRAIQRNNEGSVMFELRQALSQMELAPMPADCPGCVFVEYELSDAGLSGSGWLQDPVLLASIENFMTASLGPHYPEGTIIGLRRSASPFAPAHSLALTEDGRLWLWLANSGTVSEPLALENAASLLADLNQIPLDALSAQYEADCRGTPLESLSLKQGDAEWNGRLRCPELTLPTTLQPLYLQLDALIANGLGEAFLPEPDAAFPLDALLLYQRADGAALTLFTDSTVIASNPVGALITSTLTTTLPVSLTTSLLDSSLLQPGYQTFTLDESLPLTATVTAPPPSSTLAVRGPNGVYDAEWLDLPTLDAIRFLNDLLTSLLQPIQTEDPSAAAPENTAEPAATP